MLGSLPAMGENTPELAGLPCGSSSHPVSDLQLGSLSPAAASSRMNASSCSSDADFLIFSGSAAASWQCWLSGESRGSGGGDGLLRKRGKLSCGVGQ
jgi:hypothetical protein